MLEFSMETSVRGRYLLRLPLHSRPAPLLAGFHGYGQRAEDELEMLNTIPGSESWFCCSIEALHPIYTDKGVPGASWMTSRDREFRIEENVRYVNAVVERIRALYAVNTTLCFHGFSQGAAMAWRAALLGSHPASGIMVLGGDIPPELPLSGCGARVHLARGTGDHFYKEDGYERDTARLHADSVPFIATLYSGGHKAKTGYFQAAGEFLASLRS